MTSRKERQAQADAMRDGARIPKRCQHANTKTEWLARAGGHWEKETCNDCGDVRKLAWVDAKPL